MLCYVICYIPVRTWAHSVKLVSVDVVGTFTITADCTEDVNNHGWTYIDFLSGLDPNIRRLTWQTGLLL